MQNVRARKVPKVYHTSSEITGLRKQIAAALEQAGYRIDATRIANGRECQRVIVKVQ